MLNPASITPVHRELFKFLGYFIGFTIRSKSAMNWKFPPIFWKQLNDEPVTIADFDGLDTYTYQIIKDLEKNAKEYTPEIFDSAVTETFKTHLSDGSTIDLIENGSNVAVTHANHKEFIKKLLEVRLKETER